MAIKIANALLAIIGGIGGAMLLYWLLNKLAESLKGRWEDRVKPWMFAGPAILAIGVYLIYPAIQSRCSTASRTRTPPPTSGFKNYTSLLTDTSFLQVLFNNLLWIIIVPATTVALGLGVAVLADRLNPRGEKLAKTFIFLPMAISMVGAATIWRSIYEYKPAGHPADRAAQRDRRPLRQGPVVLVPARTPCTSTACSSWSSSSGPRSGYSMVLLSSAIKGVPEDTVEAGRIDGAGERRIFFSIVVPQIWPTVITVFITVLIGVMKVFDVVYVTTNGAYNTDVIGRRFYDEMFTQGNNGYASAIVVILMIAIIPILIYQVRHFRAEEANR